MGKDGPKQRDYVVAVIDAVKCPINITLFLICILLVYLSLRPLLRKKKSQKCEVPKMGKRDFTLEELQSFDGSGEHKRILIAVNGKIFDVTNKGQGFYGKGKLTIHVTLFQAHRMLLLPVEMHQEHLRASTLKQKMTMTIFLILLLIKCKP